MSMGSGSFLNAASSLNHLTPSSAVNSPFDYPLKLIQDLVDQLKTLKMKYEDNEMNPYLSIPYGDYHPTFIPYDYYFLPIILSLIFMLTNYESHVMNDFIMKDAYWIEKGQLVKLDRPLVFGGGGSSTHHGFGDDDHEEGHSEGGGEDDDFLMKYEKAQEERNARNDLKLTENIIYHYIPLLENYDCCFITS